MAAMEDSAGVMPVSRSASVSVAAFCCGCCWVEWERGEEENWRGSVEEMERMVSWEAFAVDLKEVMGAMERAGRERRRRRSAERQDEQIMVRLD